MSETPETPETVTVIINGASVTMPAGTMVSAAVMKTGITSFRRSVTGEGRGPVCGIGICFECSVMIDGASHCRSCQTICQSGMEVRTDG